MPPPSDLLIGTPSRSVSWRPDSELTTPRRPTTDFPNIPNFLSTKTPGVYLRFSSIFCDGKACNSLFDKYSTDAGIEDNNLGVLVAVTTTSSVLKAACCIANSPKSKSLF